MSLFQIFKMLNKYQKSFLMLFSFKYSFFLWEMFIDTHTFYSHRMRAVHLIFLQNTLLLTDLPEGNLARYRHLQCEGNTQEYMGAQARVPTLPGRGKDWRLGRNTNTLFDGAPSLSRPWLDLTFFTSGLKTHWIMRSNREMLSSHYLVGDNRESGN